MKLHSGDTLLFIGDSITDCGREYPVGEGEGLGCGYVQFFRNILLANYPELKVRILNTGIGGNQVTDLEARWQQDVIDLEPDRLAVMIGVNDVWVQFGNGSPPPDAGTALFESTYRKLIERVRPALKGLVIITPFFLETNRDEPMRAMIDKYIAVCRKLADEYDAVFADVQATFDRYMEHNHSYVPALDRVHPYPVGHFIIARSILNALGFEWMKD
jgi:lysophospholipase L1-like esterase